jgi:hypothetical protein
LNAGTRCQKQPFFWKQPILGGKIMLGFQDFTSTNSYSYSGYYYNPVMTTAWIPSFYPPYNYWYPPYNYWYPSYNYWAVAGTNPVWNANTNTNSDPGVVDSLLGGGTNVIGPASNFSSQNIATGNIGAGHQTDDPEVDNLLGRSKDVSLLNNSNTTDAELEKLKKQNRYWEQRLANETMLAETKNNLRKSEQRWTEKKLEKMKSTFNHGYLYGADGYAFAYYSGDDFYLV